MARLKLYADLYDLWFQMGRELPPPELEDQYDAAFDAALKFTEEKLGRRLSKPEFDGLMDLDYGKWLKEEREIK